MSLFSGTFLFCCYLDPEQNEGKVELNFESSQPLDELQALLEKAGVKIALGAADEAFGAQLQIETPDGMLVKINHIDPSLYVVNVWRFGLGG